MLVDAVAVGTVLSQYLLHVAGAWTSSLPSSSCDNYAD